MGCLLSILEKTNQVKKRQYVSVTKTDSVKDNVTSAIKINFFIIS